MAEPIAQFSGLATGIDSKALIDAIIKARESENTIRKQEIEHLEGENTSLEDLNSKILELSDLIEKMRTVNGGAISKKATSSDTDVYTAVAGSSALSASSSIEVVGLANTATASFTPTVEYTSADDFMSTGAGAGNVTVTVGQGASAKTITVEVTGGETTLSDFVEEFNASSNASGVVSASLVNIGTEDSAEYRLVFNTLVAGEDDGYIAISTDAVHSAQLGTKVIQQATNARFKVGGINATIERSSNTVNDVIDGVTLELKKAGTSTLGVSNDTDGSAEALQAIVDKYNEIVDFIEENDTVESSTKSGRTVIEYGSLAKTSLDNEFLSEFRSQMGAAEAADGTIVKKLSELGISTARDGTLVIETDKFKEKLLADPVGVKQVLTDFADAATGPEGFLTAYTQFMGRIELEQKGNDSTIESLNAKISNVEERAQDERLRLTATFARLEGVTSEMQQKQSQLTAVLSSL